jgi:hypothetical protein
MFNWQASGEDADGVVVVPNFWIYWVVSVPLTVFIIVGWRVWWHFQKSYYESKYGKSN